MAAPTLNTQVSGLRDLERNLQALAEQYGPKNAISALRTPMRQSLRVVAEEIRNNTPVDTGELRESTDIRISQPTRRLRQSRFVGDDAVLVGRVGWFWRNYSLWDRALSTEYGNRNTPAQPTLRPALDTLAQTVIADFAPALAKNIESTATRLGRRAAAGTLRRR